MTRNKKEEIKKEKETKLRTEKISRFSRVSTRKGRRNTQTERERERQRDRVRREEREREIEKGRKEGRRLTGV